MIAAKEKRLQLIQELRTVETMEDLSEQEKREAVKKHQHQLIAGHIASAVGREVGQQLSYLTQELVRFKEERRINAMVLLAERQRSMREAEEKGKREEEEVRMLASTLYNDYVQIILILLIIILIIMNNEKGKQEVEEVHSQMYSR
jgi:hypothetical protein